MKIRKGDNVIVLSGKFRGERGVVEEAFPAANKVIVEGLNVAKRHTKQTGTMMQAGIIDKLMQIGRAHV